jgi:prepilin signal peptidase PulO-like enzyme (type II secretory pathway)
MIIVALLLLGLCLGSFVNALVWRLHMQAQTTAKTSKKKSQYSIARGRSMCPNCQHELSVADLIPLLSWIGLRGKCRYCSQPISWQYPLVEATTAGAFVASYVFWPLELDVYGSLYFGLWLVMLVGLAALVVYDLRWMILPNKVVFSLYWVASVMIMVQILSEQSLEPFVRALVGVLVGGGLFYLLFQLSNAKWIGGGDVKLGFLLGAVVGGPEPALLVLFFASLLGSVVSLPLLLTKKAHRGTKIPFGPFLILGAFVVQLVWTKKSHQREKRQN